MPDMVRASPVDRLSRANSLRRSSPWKRVEVVGRENPPPTVISLRALSGDRLRTSPSVSRMPVASTLSPGSGSRVSSAATGLKSFFGTETGGLGLESEPAAGVTLDFGTSSPLLASSPEGQGRRMGVVVDRRLVTDAGSRRHSEGVAEAAAAASANCSAAKVCEEEAAAGDTAARAAATVDVAVVVREPGCVLNVCPTGGRQVFLLSVRLNGRPLLDN